MSLHLSVSPLHITAPDAQTGVSPLCHELRLLLLIDLNPLYDANLRSLSCASIPSHNEVAFTKGARECNKIIHQTEALKIITIKGNM